MSSASTDPGAVPTAAVRPMATIRVGEAASIDWDVTADQILAFAALSGDHNPLHVDPEFARRQGFADQVAHGYLLGAKVSALVGMLLPGRDCLILETALAFPRPVHPGDRVTITGTVDQLSAEQSILRVKVRASRREGDGSVLVARGHVLCRNR